MHTIFIIDIHKNPGLLRFTETKVFFDAKNQSANWAKDCVVVDHIDQIAEKEGIVINSGEFITSRFRLKHAKVDSLIDARGDPDLIPFTDTYNYDYTKKPPYLPGSKQLYILENLFKTVLRSKKLVYLDNTESYESSNTQAKHFFGLASGWKSIKYVKDLGIENLESITIFDKCKRQLEFQKYLHSCKQLPDSVDIDSPVYGTYNPLPELKEFWHTWHQTPVKFETLDLFDTPVFPEHSFVWISNVFKYEPTIFEFGWQHCKSARQRLFLSNKSSIITER
jgi:hypothetical protein